MTNHQSDFRPDEPGGDPLEQAIQALKQSPIPTGPSSDTIAATLMALQSRELDSKKSSLLLPRTRLMRIMKAGSGVFVTACLIVAVLTLRSPASAYSQVIEQARKAKSMSYLSTITMSEAAAPAVVRELVAEDGRSRTEHMFQGKPSGTITISDASGFTRLTLIDSEVLTKGITNVPVNSRKSAIVSEVRSSTPVVEGGWRNSLLKSLQSLKDKPEKELGEKQLDGRTVKGFEATYGNMHFTMWVDVATGRPALIDYDTALGQHVTMTEFRFNEQLDESLFSFEPPAGYEVQNAPKLPTVGGGEDSLVGALRAYTAKSEGKFPASLTDWSEWVVLFTRDNTTGTLDEATTAAMAKLGTVTPFLIGMKKSDYAYRGKGLTTQDSLAIVFWYRKPDGVYRAIYGDLSVKDITADKLPKD